MEEKERMEKGKVRKAKEKETIPREREKAKERPGNATSVEKSGT